MKRILSLVLVAMMVIGVMPMAFAADKAATDSAYAEALGFLSAEQIGVYQGQEYGLAADEGVTRAQMAMFTARFITGITDDEEWATSVNDSGFADVEDFDGYSDAMLGAISFASQKGIVNGVSATEFDPEDGVEYREAITMIVRALGFTYKASGYPWNYYTKANELGILDGITGVDMTEEINRGVVAQLLYNAMFAEIDGQTVAAKTFDIDVNVVIITATNEVTLTAEDTLVLRTGAVAFKTMDAQGEPKGVAYHVPYTQFGLKSATEANASVGHVYLVYTTGSMANIVRCVSLTDVYENRGYVAGETVIVGTTANAANSTTTGATTAYYLTIGGTKYQIVKSFDELNSTQGGNTDKVGSEQIKLYSLIETKTYSLNNEYLLHDGIVYKVEGTELKVYAQYSSFLDAYYTLENGQWKVVDLDSLLFTEGTTTAGSYMAAQLPSALKGEDAYADYVAADIDLDGKYDRVSVRLYQFGQVVKTTRDSDSDGVKETFMQFKYNNNKFDNTLSTTTAEYMVAGDDAGESFRFTGEALSKIANGAYVLYYVDATQKEIDVLEVIGAKEGDGDYNYVAQGYVRNFNIGKNTITIDNVTHSYGHNHIYRSTLRQPNATDIANQSGTYLTNYNAIAPFYNQFVTYVVLDRQVLYITTANAQPDYVIIDQIVGIEADGIVVNGYSTIAGGYDEFKIKSYNGWALGGDFDFSLFYQLGLWGNTSTYNVWDLIPLTNKIYYKVVTEKDGSYDLTDATDADVLARNVSLTVNAYGYIVGTDGANGFGSTKYTSVNDKDYWLFLETAGTSANNKVYDFNGKINQATFTGLTALKASDNDYVFIAGAGFGFDEGVFGSDIKYMLYRDFIPEIGNVNLWQVSPFEYSIVMTNVTTGALEQVLVDAEFIKAQSQFGNPGYITGGYGGVGYVDDLFTDGKIYRIVDGVLSSNTAYDLDTVAAFYGTQSDVVSYKIGAEYTKADYANLETAIATEIVKILFPTMESTALVNSYKSKVTEINCIDGFKVLSSSAAFAFEDDVTYKVNYIIYKDGTAIAWVTAKENAPWIHTGTMNFVTIGDATNGSSWAQSQNAALGSAWAGSVVDYVYNEHTQKLTVSHAWDNTTISAFSTNAASKILVSYNSGIQIRCKMDETMPGVESVAKENWVPHERYRGFTHTFENVEAIPAGGEMLSIGVIRGDGFFSYATFYVPSSEEMGVAWSYSQACKDPTNYPDQSNRYPTVTIKLNEAKDAVILSYNFSNTTLGSITGKKLYLNATFSPSLTEIPAANYTVDANGKLVSVDYTYALAGNALANAATQGLAAVIAQNPINFWIYDAAQTSLTSANSLYRVGFKITLLK